MNWFEQRIRRYEHRRWTTDDNRMVRPFAWGLEHIGGDANADDESARVFLRDYSKAAIQKSKEWYEPAPATDYKVDGEEVLTFTSAIRSPHPENNTVYGQVFRGK